MTNQLNHLTKLTDFELGGGAYLDLSEVVSIVRSPEITLMGKTTGERTIIGFKYGVRHTVRETPEEIAAIPSPDVLAARSDAAFFAEVKDEAKGK